MTFHHRSLRLAALAAGLLALACASNDRAPADLLPETSRAEASAPLGGEALVQRKNEMRRAHGDMVHFSKTLESLKHRDDKNGLVLFSKFLDAYLGMHVDPLLAGEWQSRHPELTALDANLRFAKAELLIRLKMPRRAQSVMDQIEARFQGREDMLVDYPHGTQRSLGEGLQLLSERKWQG
ncbi:MAG: hypothetical protein ACQGVC_10015 [Myxococcota bacterium]